MTTDEEIREVFHTRFGTAIADVAVSPGTLAAVRRRHAREQRMMMIGAPVGVAVLVAGSVVAATSLGAANHGSQLQLATSPSPTPSQTPTTPGPTVTLLGHALSMPGGWTVRGPGKIIDLDTLQPPQPVGGDDESVLAISPDGSQSIDVTVYHGAIAGGESQVTPAPGNTVHHVTIAGLPATVYAFGTSQGCTFTKAGKHVRLRPGERSMIRLTRRHHNLAATEISHGPGHEVLIGRCPNGVAVFGEAGQVTTGVTYGDGDFLMAESSGLSTDQVVALLDTVLLP